MFFESFTIDIEHIALHDSHNNCDIAFTANITAFSIPTSWCKWNYRRYKPKIHHLIERTLISMISFNYKSKENGLSSNI
jgi:hypothetical protein